MMRLEDDLGFLLGRTDRAMKHHLTQHLRPLGITLQEYLMMVGLSEGDGISQDALAKRMHIDISFVTRILQHLEQEGLVTRAKDERDARVNLVWLTPQGHALREKIEAIRAQGLQ
ncbi:MAG: MarR family winged helix-turn-helix transcriptional regulator, partial [Anaerolineae bacterium]